jgi:integrative and conjugative element protein (TIGR02256 family)
MAWRHASSHDSRGKVVPAVRSKQLREKRGLATMTHKPKEPQRGLVATSATHSQSVSISADVQKHLWSQRQSRFWHRESGGQLFGTVNAENIDVVAAAGPYPLDSRSRYSYRSDPGSAQRAIEEAHRNGLHYLGEWHTHPQGKPSASGEDLRTIATVFKKSDSRSNELLLVIQGLSIGRDGVALYSSNGLRLTQWEFR